MISFVIADIINCGNFQTEILKFSKHVYSSYITIASYSGILITLKLQTLFDRLLFYEGQ